MENMWKEAALILVEVAARNVPGGAEASWNHRQEKWLQGSNFKYKPLEYETRQLPT